MLKDTTIKRPERRLPPKSGWPKLKFVPNRAGSQQYRARKSVNGTRWTEWGTDPEDALDAWKDWWKAGCPSRDQQKAEQISASSSDDDPAAKPPTTVEELCRRFLEKRKPSLATSTHDRYERDIRLRIVPRFGARLFPLDRPTLVRWEESMEAENLHTTSIRRCVTVIQAAFTWSVKQGWIADSPAAKIDMPKARRGMRAQEKNEVVRAFDIPNVDEVRAFLRAARDAHDPLYVLWKSGFKLGPRPGELVALSEGQVKVGPSGSFQFVAIDQKLIRGASTPAEKDAGGRIATPRVKGELRLERPKWGSERTIELDPDDELFVDLVDQIEKMRDLAVRHGWNPQWQGFLFRRLPGGRQGKGGDPYAPDCLPALFKEAAKRAGWRAGRTPHYMRHFAASNLIRKGYSSKEACEIFGQKTVRVFDETYAHVIREVRHAVRLSEATSDLD